MEYFQSMPDPKNRPTKRCKGLSTIFSITCGFKDLRTSYPYTTYFQETTEIYNSTQLGFRLKTLTIKTPLASFWCLYCYLWTYFTPCSSVSIVNYEHIIAGWVAHRIISIGLKCKSFRVNSIAVSSILKRNSFNINQVTCQANNISKRLCRLHDFLYICNDLVKENYLWKDGLNPTNEGSHLLLNSFINYLNRNVNNNIWLMD